jgi:hypothetical protein
MMAKGSLGTQSQHDPGEISTNELAERYNEPPCLSFVSHRPTLSMATTPVEAF